MPRGDQAKHNVVTKFTPTYCADVQRKLTKMGRTPRLRFCKPTENAGMYVVIMDCKDGTHAYVPLVGGKHTEQLRTAVKTLHEEDYVHSDIQEPNV